MFHLQWWLYWEPSMLSVFISLNLFNKKTFQLTKESSLHILRRWPVTRSKSLIAITLVTKIMSRTRQIFVCLISIAKKLLLKILRLTRLWPSLHQDPPWRTRPRTSWPKRVDQPIPKTSNLEKMTSPTRSSPRSQDRSGSQVTPLIEPKPSSNQAQTKRIELLNSWSKEKLRASSRLKLLQTRINTFPSK